MPGKTLVVLGSGPGIGIAVAKTFAVRGFTHVALVSRNASRLSEDQDAVLDAIQERGYSCQVKTWTCNLADLEQLGKTLNEIKGFGNLECVLFNAARVAGKPAFEESIEAIEQDFRLSCLSLYETAKWAIPVLKENAASTPDASPSFFVTNSFLWKEPHPGLPSLSLVKSAQRTLLLCFHADMGKDVHLALLSIGGPVSPEAKNLTPENIANKCWELYKQPKSSWSRDMELPE